MAEALGALGSVAAVAQLTGEFVKLTTNLRHYVKVLRKAPEEVQAFLLETLSFTGLLNLFTELVDRPVKDKTRREGREKLVQNIKTQCKCVRDKMKDFVYRFSALANENLTPLGSLIERIRYLLAKPDMKELRLSIHMAATMVNLTSVLFLWQSNNHVNESLLEQLKNLLPIAKKEMGKLADHQRQHGLGYNSGMPDDIMLVVSKEIQRQVARAIKPYIEAETARDRFSGPRRRESRRDSSIIDEADFRRRWASPSRRSGSDAESIGDLPRRPANRVSFQNATNTTATPGHDGVVAKTIDTDESGVQPPNPPTDSADHTSERGSDKASSNESKRVEVTETAQDSHNPVEHKLEPRESWEHYSLDNSDPNQPRIHRCTYSHCSLCGGTHCGHKPCKVLEQTTLMEEKPPNDTPLGSSPPESKKSITGAASSREDATSPQGVLAQHSPALTVESEEQSGQSDKATGSPKNGSSRTSLASPSSKSSSPSTEGSRSPHAKDRDSRSAQVVTNEAQEMPDPSKGASGVSTTERQSQPESRPEPDLDDRRSVQGGQRKLEGRELWAKEEQRRRRRSRPVSYQSHVSDDSDTGSGNPSPYVPVPPFGGPGSRRRPRRPRPTQ